MWRSFALKASCIRRSCVSVNNGGRRTIPSRSSVARHCSASDPMADDRSASRWAVVEPEYDRSGEVIGLILPCRGAALVRHGARKIDHIMVGMGMRDGGKCIRSGVANNENFGVGQERVD